MSNHNDWLIVCYTKCQLLNKPCHSDDVIILFLRCTKLKYLYIELYSEILHEQKLLLPFFCPYPRICFYWGGREEGRRERGEGGRRRAAASHRCPKQGLNLQPRYVPQSIIKPQPFGVRDNALSNWANLARAGVASCRHHIVNNNTYLFFPIFCIQQI